MVARKVAFDATQNQGFDDADHGTGTKYLSCKTNTTTYRRPRGIHAKERYSNAIQRVQAPPPATTSAQHRITNFPMRKEQTPHTDPLHHLRRLVYITLTPNRPSQVQPHPTPAPCTSSQAFPTNSHRVQNMASAGLATSQQFNSLKSQIISLATALYGTTTSPSATFDVLPFSSPRRTPGGTALNQYTHGAALIYYTGPASAPYTSWEMLSYTDSQHSVNAGAQQLLDDMQKGIGDVIGKLASVCVICWVALN